MIAQATAPVKTQVSTTAQIAPERTGIGVNPAHRAGRIVTRTWQAHQQLVASNPDAAIAYHDHVVAERAIGYGLYMDGQPARSCASQTQWGGWLQAQNEYNAGRTSAWATTPQATDEMTPAQRMGYLSGMAFQQGAEVRNVQS